MDEQGQRVAPLVLHGHEAVAALAGEASALLDEGARSLSVEVAVGMCRGSLRAELALRPGDLTQAGALQIELAR
ncbi:hypothetical protein [Allokutzneria oryzae]|uniref:Uncharacterized protein n=1 Tax=Allokutzneria oryzae TaxID=1378989 RepID=A0ABV6ABC6_9PSEU